MDRSAWIYVACALAGMLVWHLLWTRLRAWFDRSGRQRRARLALRAERTAEKILKKAGYRVLEAQARVPWPVVYGDETLVFELRADFIVEAGRRFVAEVKTGDVVSLQHGATRRQLLEYLLAFDVDGVLLIDAEHGAIEEVAFPGLFRAASMMRHTLRPQARSARRFGPR